MTLIFSKKNVWLLITFSLICNFGCTIEEHDNVIKNLSDVPDEAVFVGGADGGVYAYLEINNNVLVNQTYYVEIYSYNTGELWHKGNMIMEPSNDPKLNTTQIIDLLQGWDGEQLLLSNGCTLKAIDR